MIHRPTTLTTIALASLMALSSPLCAQDADRGEGDVGQSAQYGSVTPNEVFSLVTRLGDALLAVPQIREGSAFQQIIAQEDMDKALGGLQQRTEFTGKTPSDVYGLIELAVGRLEAHLGLSSSANSNSAPASPANTEFFRAKPTERSEPESVLAAA